MSALEDLRRLVVTRQALDAAIERLTEQALREGAERTSVAGALEISRASLYRLYGHALGPSADSVDP